MAFILQDIRYAFRGLRRSSAFTAAAVATLALGMGATTATFSLANAVLLQPLPFEEPDRLVRIEQVTPGGVPFPLSEPNFVDFQRSSRTLREIAAIAPRTLTLTGTGDAIRLQGAAVSRSLFGVLGVPPAIGRGFLPEEDRRGAAPVVVLSHELWRQRFASERALVGRAVQLDGVSHVVVGVMPEGFAFLPAEVWVPLGASDQADRTNNDLDAVGRLSASATLDSVRTELRAIAGRIGREHPEQRGWSVQVTWLSDWLIGASFRRTMWILFGAVGLLLAIACSNVANLLMARATSRQEEFAIRSALGARRAHLLRQLLVESLVLASAGGVLGVVLSFWMADGLSVLASELLTVAPTVRIDGRLLAFAAGLVVATTVAFGVVPAWYAAGRGMASGRRQGGRTTTGGRRITEGFVVAQIALAMLLLVGAGLMIRSFLRLQQVDPGFDASGVVAVPLSLPDRSYPPERVDAFFRELTARLLAVPGVTSVGATTTNPFRQWGFSNDVTPEDRAAEAPPTGLLQAGWRAVTPGFFEALRIPIVSGRAFPAAGVAGRPREAIVSESLARRLWPGRDAVGRRFYWGGVGGRPWTVIGVAGDIRDLRVEAEPEPTLYVPHDRVPMTGMTVLVRAGIGAGRVAAPIRQAIASLDPDIPVPEIRALAANRAEAVNVPRVRTLMLTLIGGVALLLASVGLYGLVAFGAAERMREVGVRIALGARPGDIVRMFVSRGLALAAAGLAAGLAGAWVLARALESLLFETSARDPLLFLAAALVLSGVTAVASYVPARRAAGLDPVRVLNST